MTALATALKGDTFDTLDLLLDRYIWEDNNNRLEGTFTQMGPYNYD